MDQSQKTILTPFNFFEWKAEMEIMLRVKGLYRVTMATEAEPNAAAEKIQSLEEISTQNGPPKMN